MTENNIEMIFFDVGNVFVSDDPAAAFLYRRLYEHLGGESRWTPEEFFEVRLEHVRNGGHLWSFVRSFVDEGEYSGWRQRTRAELFEQWEQYSPPIPGMAEVAHELRQHYRLGLIANQPRQIRDVLTRRGLWDLFEVHAISEDLGIEKPDPRIFAWALEKAGVDPARTLMVGDRVDNDVAPARRLGMKTLWLSMSLERRGWMPRNRFERAYVESVRRHCVSSKEPLHPDEQPDFVARSPEELLALLVPAADSGRVAQ